MAGHSKFKNIMHRKGAQDKKRSNLFSKLSREITVAAKMGMPDPDMNPRIRLAVQNAKAQSMPKDNIQRAIDKASGGDEENYEEVRYEGYGPGGVALALIALIGGSVLKGAGIASLANPAAFVIVVVGTFAASLIQTPKSTFMRAWKIFAWIFKPPLQDKAVIGAGIETLLG